LPMSLFVLGQKFQKFSVTLHSEEPMLSTPQRKCRIGRHLCLAKCDSQMIQP
jgi:hypothetical protein